MESQEERACSGRVGTAKVECWECDEKGNYRRQCHNSKDTDKGKKKEDQDIMNKMMLRRTL